MANEITNTEADVLIPELWRPKMLEARYAKMTFGKRILSVDGDVAAKGDILHIPIEPTVSVNAVGSTGSVTNQALTPTESQLTVDQWREATIDVVDKAQRQSIVDLVTAFQPGMSKAMADDADGLIANQYSNITTNSVGSTSAPLDTVNPDLLTAAVQKLLVLSVPVDDPNDVSFMFHATVWAQLKKIAEFNNANLTGKSTGGALEMKVPDIYGIPTFFTTKIKSTAGNLSVYKNFLLHRQALAWGMQKNFRLEMLARTKKSQPVSADWLFGIRTVRENHACLINTAA